MKLRTIYQWAGGSGEGRVRRGDYRNYYKGHLDKIKGEGGRFSWGREVGSAGGEVEGWGEKAHNCN